MPYDPTPLGDRESLTVQVEGARGDAERLYVVPPVEANAGAAIVVHCPRPDVKGCTCIANQFFDEWGNRLEKEGRRIKARESVVSFYVI